MTTTMTNSNTTDTTLAGLHIEARRWFQKSYGNTYHSVRIYTNWNEPNKTKELAYLPYSYGYSEQWLQTALDWLATNGYIPKADGYPLASGYCVAAKHGTQYLREELHGTYSVVDVNRKKDL